MKTIPKIIGLLNLLFLIGLIFLFLNLGSILALISTSLSIAVLVLFILVPFFWGIINALGFLMEKPVPLSQLSFFEKVLALLPLFNLFLIATFLFVAFMLS